MKSRKFWLAVTTAALIIANDGLGFNFQKETIIEVMSVIISFILGQSLVDSKAQNAPVVTVTK